MRRNYLILGVLAVSCFMLLQAGCQKEAGMAPKPKATLTTPKPASSPTKDETAAEANEPTPKITFEKIVHNFGQVGPMTKNTYEFKFTNTGDGLLKIKKVEPSCVACTVANLSKKEYAPGESGTLKVTYHSDKRLGPTKYRVFVHSNDKNNPKVELSIRAGVVTKVTHEPKRLKLLLREENAGCPDIRLASLDNQPFAIKQFKSTANCITADYDPSVKKTELVLEPKVDIKKLQRVLKGRIDISLTHPAYDTVTIPFNLLPRFKITPASLIILKAEPKKPIIRNNVWVLNNYDEDFEIEATSSKKGAVKVLHQKKVGKRYNLKLEITPPGAEDKKSFFSDVLFVDIKGGGKLEITCRGFYSKK